MTNIKNRHVIKISLLAVIIVSLFFVPWTLLKIRLTPVPDTVEEQISQGIDFGFDGMIVYTHKGGEEPKYYAAGWKDRENKIPADPHSLFKIASIGKLYDAVAITKLIKDKRLSLDNTLSYYLPELIGRVEYAEKITLQMMVQHRSGIPNLTETPDFWINPPKNKHEALERIFDLPANFKPGEDYEYSNTNYLLISEIIEKVLGYNKFQFIKEEILTPLGLKNTFKSIHDIDMNKLMSGYYIGVDNDIKTVDYGSMIASAEDVGIFLRALNNGSLFKDSDEQEIYSSLYKYEHTGLIPGYQSIAKHHKDIDTVVIQFVNTTNFDGDTWFVSEVIYNRIVRILKKHHPA